MTLDDALAASEPIIAGLAYRLAPRPHDRDDLAQVGRLAAWLAWETFDGTGQVDAWMCAKARWAMIDHLRAFGPLARGGRMRAPVSLDADDGLALGLVDPAAGPERVAVARSEVDATVVWLAGLPERTADAVTMGCHEWAAKYGRVPSRASQLRGEALRARAA